MSYRKCNCYKQYKHCHHHQQHCHSANGNNANHCHKLGPFIAVDPSCLVPGKKMGSIIPFSSGTVPAVLVNAAGGLIGTTSLVGFGTSIPGVSVVGNQINLLAPLLNEAFSVPREGSITSISASFRATLAITFAGIATVNARIYRAPAGSSTFTATDAAVDLTPLAGALAANQEIFGTSENFAPVQVAPGDRLLMVFSVSGVALLTTVTGVASAGINIE